MNQLSLPLAAPPPRYPPATKAGPTPEPGYRNVSALERFFRAVMGPKVIVKLTDNSSTMISFRERRGVLYLRLHVMFCAAPDSVLRAAACFISGRGYRRAHADRLDAWIEAHRPPRTARRRKPARPIGEVHDLQAIFDALNHRWFHGGITATVTWGTSRTKTRRKRSSMQLGAYDDEAKEIRIHPALDQSWVPAYFVASVVFHEMLHEKHDAPMRNGRRQVHSPAFLAEERRYPDYARARAWESKHLDRLLSY
ncbi:MAG: hypothetical protein AAF449_18995 [Myxococcota bacterium]